MNDYIKMIDHDEYKEVLEALESGFIEIIDIEQHRKATCEALEKQIPKKPQTATYFYGFKYSCPACSKTLCFDFDEQKEYCPECGQALDWSDENE